MSRTPLQQEGQLSKLGIHLRVWGRAVLFGLGAYACIHGLVWLMGALRTFLE